MSNIKIKKIDSEISSIIIDEQKTYNSLSFKKLTDLLKALKKLLMKPIIEDQNRLNTMRKTGLPQNPLSRVLKIL